MCDESVLDTIYRKSCSVLGDLKVWFNLLKYVELMIPYYEKKFNQYSITRALVHLANIIDKKFKGR